VQTPRESGVRQLESQRGENHAQCLDFTNRFCPGGTKTSAGVLYQVSPSWLKKARVGIERGSFTVPSLIHSVSRRIPALFPEPSPLQPLLGQPHAF
jgi:hypothetical protein